MTTLITAGALVVLLFTYLIGAGIIFRWAVDKWGPSHDSPETFFTTLFWPITAAFIILLYTFKYPVKYAFKIGVSIFEIGSRPEEKLPKAKVVSKR